jgi:hypothetical protein
MFAVKATGLNNRRIILAWLTGCLLAEGHLAGAEERTIPKAVPFMQAVPLPNQEISFQRDGVELTRYHFSPTLHRPFIFPVLGPSGRSLTRMGHPRDPESHSHHNSVWISHHDVDGTSFWDDRAMGRIVHQRIERFEDGETEASVATVNSWNATNKTLLTERRRIAVRTLPKDEWLLILDLQLEARSESVTLGRTPFGLIGVRMAKTIGVNDGGGTIRNAEGAVNEPDIFWKPSRWVDYSGPITPKAIEGITLMDHPRNPNHPTVFHVRNDGWMGASVTFAGPRTIEPGKPLKLRYGLYVHRGMPKGEIIQQQWQRFARESP